jgi:predicted glycoside hydrolase/deacetylase ChbG (UPF0249 family)
MKQLFTLVAACLLATSAFADHHEGKKYLIIHADDAGMSHSVNRGTIDSMKNGVVSSASIMVPCPWFKEFAEIARENPDFDYGIHLTLNSEWDNYRWGPVAPKGKVPSLVDEEGYLWDNVRQVAQHAKAEEVAVELRAQINRALKFGVPLTHLDTHMGAVLSRPDLFEVYTKLASEFDLPVMMLREFDVQRKREYPALIVEQAGRLVKQLENEGFPLLDTISQFYGGDTHDERRAQYVKTLQNLEPGVSQLIIHCGYADDELRAITESAERRNGDRDIFMEPQIAKLIKSLEIEVITWKQFREINDAKQN